MFLNNFSNYTNRFKVKGSGSGLDLDLFVTYNNSEYNYSEMYCPLAPSIVDKNKCERRIEISNK